MIRWNKFSLVFVGLCLTLYSFSQENLLDYSNSLKFAKYLSATNQYKLASQEYERINFLWPNHNDVVFELIHNYRLGNECEKLDYCLQLVSKNNLFQSDENFSKEILRFSLNCKSHGEQYFKILESLNKKKKYSIRLVITGLIMSLVRFVIYF